jgi:hypothetical protein
MWRWRPDALGRWRAVPRTERREVGVFLHSWCDAGLCGYYFILALAKTVTLEGSAPRERGRRAGFCPAALAAKPGR